MKPLTTERLVLRPFIDADCAAIQAALEDLDVASWIPLLPYPYGAAEARAFVARQKGPKADAQAVTHEGALIGCMTIGVELGYWFVKSSWGKGFATEAARAVVARYFGQTRAPLQSGYQLGNDRSLRVLSKLGFEPTERVTRSSVPLQKDVTIQRMELTHKAWEGAK